ncbi:MAG: amidohydrolase family protein [Nitrososphaerales archaeon]
MSEGANRMISLWDIHPNFVECEARIKHLDQTGIDVQVTMVQQDQDPNAFGLKDDELMRLSKMVNDECARFQNESRGRIFALGTAPLAHDAESMIQEMRRAVKVLGLKGFMVLSNVRGEPIDKFSSFWEEAERLGAIVYIHPANSGTKESRQYEFDYDLMHVFGWPYETTTILSRLVFSGVMKKHPNLKIISHHMGGMVPFYWGRIGETYRQKQKQFVKTEGTDGKRILDFGARASDALSHASLDRPVLYYFRMFYYDTAVGGSAAAIKCGYDVLGAERIIFGTDYPWGPEGGKKRLELYPEAVREACPSSADQKKIFEENMAKLLKI